MTFEEMMAKVVIVGDPLRPGHYQAYYGGSLIADGRDLEDCRQGAQLWVREELRKDG